MPPEFLLDPNGAAVIARLARALGESGNEVALLLAGSRTTQRPVQLDRILVPRQTALNSDRGCGLIVDGGCLNRLGPQMRQASRSIYGILHSHPTEAYHSPTDAEGPLMRFHGAFSIVIPDFGRRRELLDGSAAYRFDVESGWKSVPPNELLVVVKGKPAEVIYDELPALHCRTTQAD